MPRPIITSLPLCAPTAGEEPELNQALVTLRMRHASMHAQWEDALGRGDEQEAHARRQEMDANDVAMDRARLRLIQVSTPSLPFPFLSFPFLPFPFLSFPFLPPFPSFAFSDMHDVPFLSFLFFLSFLPFPSPPFPPLPFLPSLSSPFFPLLSSCRRQSRRTGLCGRSSFVQICTLRRASRAPSSWRMRSGSDI